MSRNRLTTVLAAAALAVVASPGLASASPDSDQAVARDHSTAIIEVLALGDGGPEAPGPNFGCGVC
ncbi:hypothetical protein Cme02nite_33170 [Catellatospora methionotrophica]|uniref:Uncharacterized protein n=1 Tax=Catellatospora methionotrophica TaxID=121620 RepID=A0A8J3LLQ9_9ACTN|nr:hypothetical protein [Catellatospora methionotrophica]GIG14985.1 hypothetical protein Cme02nite_33170 [Catellatospora methionotrophica]